MAKYDPLGRHLRRKGGADVLMTFDDVERVIAMLPKSASLPAWWGNESSQRTRYVQCRAWLDAGYEASLMPGGNKVRFSRKRTG